MCAKLNELSVDFLVCIVEFMKKVFVDVGLESSVIDYVVLVGGMICMLVVVDEVKKLIGKEFYKGVNFDEVVVVGVLM